MCEFCKERDEYKAFAKRVFDFGEAGEWTLSMDLYVLDDGDRYFHRIGAEFGGLHDLLENGPIYLDKEVNYCPFCGRDLRKGVRK